MATKGNQLIYVPVTGIDLTSADYTIPHPGSYQVSNYGGGSGNGLIFPSPVTFDGQTIIVINTDGSPAVIDNTNTFAPYLNGTSGQVAEINAESMFICTAINSQWRGGYLSA